MTGNRLIFRLMGGLAIVVLAALLLVHRPALASRSRQDSYPPPAQATPEGAPLNVTPLPYPPAEPAPGSASPAPIGDQDGLQATQDTTGEVNAAQLPQSAGNRGLLYLWLGFLATLLIFGACVFGAALLFTRRNES
jgi:hypothetical protein